MIGYSHITKIIPEYNLNDRLRTKCPQKVHIVSELDFSEIRTSQVIPELTDEERDLVFLVTTIDYSAIPPIGKTRAYIKETEQRDFGTEKNQLPGYKAVPCSAKNAIPAHFKESKELARQYSEGKHRML